jgi:predicted RecB family nuclease
MSCPWRDGCIPELTKQQHVSLLPGVSRRQATALRELGVDTWQDAIRLPEAQMLALGFEPPELRRMQDVAMRIREGRVVFRHSIKSEVLRRMTAVSLEFDSLGAHRRSEIKPSPNIIWYEQGREIRKITLSEYRAPAWPNELIHATGRTGLAFFGTTDVDAFTRLVQSSAKEKTPCTDVFGIVEQWVHVPFTGLELSSISSFVGHRFDAASPSGGRVQAIRALLDWMGDRRAAAS